MYDETVAQFIGYMDRVLSNARMDYIRKRNRVNSHEILLADMPDLTIQEQAFELTMTEQLSDVSLQKALRSLSEREARVLLHLVCAREPVKDVAKRIGVTPNNVYRLKSRALRKLRDALLGGMIDG